MSAVQTGNNMLAVAIVNAQSSITLDFDMTLRLMASSKSFPRYWDSTATYAHLFDQKRETRLYETIPAGTYDVVLTLSGDRAEAYNKYCFVTNWDALRHDPREWKVYGSKDGVDYVELDHQQEVYFDERLTSNCFFMLNNNVAYSYYKLSLIKARVDEAGNHYALCQWNLYLEDFSQAVVPELAMEPATQVGYTDAEFPKAVVSSLYYHSFTISPALPSGLRLSPLDGSISGVLSSPLAATTYQLSAVNHLGETKTTSITVSVEVCSNDKIAFTLEFVMEGGGSECSFELKDLSNDQIVASRTKFANWNTLSLPMCQHATTYGLILKKTNYGGWGSNYVNIKLMDGTLLLKESLAAGVMQKEYQFNPAYAVVPKWTTWSYLTDGTAAPEGWNTLSGAPASWSTAMAADLPAGNGITQYYYVKFTAANTKPFSVMDISVNLRGGAVIYLNGQEVRRINMPQGEVTSTTLANNLYPTTKKVTTGEFVQGGRLQTGENILAIELHRYEAGTEVNTFDASAILVMDNMYMITDGTGTSNPHKDGNEGTDKVFDNNSSTKFCMANRPSTLTFDWTYNNDRREICNNYGVVSANDCNVRHPSGWKLLASNDGSNWDELDSQTNQFFTEFKQQKRYDVSNVRAYNKYRILFNEFNNPSLPNDATWCRNTDFQFADFSLFAKRIPAVCPAKDGYEAAVSGHSSSKPCEEEYTGVITRYCNTDGEWEDEVRACIVGPPKSIKYDVKELNLKAKKAMDPITPTIVGLDVTVSTLPTLPSGLSIDTKTGTISGTPKEEMETKMYTISVINDSGKVVYTTLSITIEKAAVNWLLIIIIVVVVVVVIGVVIAVIITASKSKQGSKSLPKGSKSKPMPKNAVQPKAAVKV